jgi:AraC family transcriptional regulator
MGWVESLQKAIDYMEDHLLDELPIESIAKQANVSEFHFQRIFSVLTDITVGEYLRRRRLTLAAQELSTTDSRIIDVALKYGYDTPESFA